MRNDYLIKKGSVYKKQQNIGLIYILPWIIGFLVFILYPFASSFYYSFTDYNLLSEPKSVGFENYIETLFHDWKFIKAYIVTNKYVLMAVPGKITVALIVALILNRSFRGIHLYRTIFYLPSIFGGSVAISILWKFLFMHDGLVNKITGLLNISPVEWLGNPKTSLFTISLLSVWQFGSSMVIFLAGLKQIPTSLYETAMIDGASRISKFFRITLPLLSPVLFFNILMQTITAFQEFTAAFIISGGNGSPLYSTYMYVMMLYDNTFTYFKAGYASAQSWILFISLMILTLLLFKVSSFWIYYEYGKILGWYSLADFGDEPKEISPMVVWGCNYSIRKKVLIEAGGFHPDSMPQELIKYRGDGEIHVSRKIQEMRYKTLYNPKASVYHWVPKSRMTMGYIQSRNFNQGVSDSFTNIRSSYDHSENKYRKTNPKSFYQRIKKKSSKEILSTIKQRLMLGIRRSIQAIPRCKQDNINYIKEEMKKAYQEGYKYHQNEVKKDPELLKWVLKENYFES